MSTFTKEQLIDRARGEIELAQITLRNGGSDTPHAVEERLRLYEIALEALTAPDCPPKGAGAIGRSMDASYRRQGAITGWAACLHRILKGLK